MATHSNGISALQLQNGQARLVSALTAALGCSPTSWVALASMVDHAGAQPVVGPGGNRRGQAFHSGPRDRSSHRSCFKDAATTAEMLVGVVGRHRTRDGNIPGRLTAERQKSPPTACRIRPRTLRRNRRRSADASRRKLDGCVRLRCAPRRSPQCPWPHVGTDRRSPRPAVDPAQIFSNLSQGWARGVIRHGNMRLQGEEAVCRTYLDVVRLSASTAAGTYRQHAAFRSLFRLATNAKPLTYSMLWQTLANRSHVHKRFA